jgi:Regulator of G protein signaling domain
MPQDLQALSPKPDWDVIGDAPTRIPKLAIKSRPSEKSEPSPTIVPIAPPSPSSVTPSEKDSRETLRTSHDVASFPPSPAPPPATIAPWQVGKMEARPATTNSDSFSSTTIEKPVGPEAAKQPFRTEVLHSICPHTNIQVDSMVVTFLTSSGAKELNLPSQLRTRTIQAARETTHPDVFEPVNDHVWDLLLRSSHPNFIRYIICNGNPPRVWFAHFLGAFTILLGLMEALLCIGYGVGRGWRVFSLPLFLIGAATTCAALYGMCVVLHGLHHRQLRPYELFRDEETGEYAPNKERKLRIFDKEVWVEEPALRQLQDRIFFQALAVASLFTLLMAAIFLSVPNAK